MKQTTYNRQLLEEAASAGVSHLSPASGSVAWSCPSNIAMIKYWGKRPVQLPMNPSLSLTLDKARTITRVTYAFDPAAAGPSLRFRFEGKQVPAFETRVARTVTGLSPYLPTLAHASLEIESRNTFPHSSGIASSASSMGALALCLVQMEERLRGGDGKSLPMKKVSFLARLGSGSASRSLFGGFSLWGESEGWTGSSDEYAVPVDHFHESFRGTRDTILVVESGAKKVSSSVGHGMMDKNPFASARFDQARENLQVLRIALEDGDWPRFIEVMEEEALSLHAMMLSSKPGYLLMQPGTVAVIQKVRQYRKETGSMVGFTLDAGANVHLIYPGEEEKKIHGFITGELLPYCEQNRIIRDRMGKGPEEL
jgi:diphosphomevalonate decarboxylase